MSALHSVFYEFKEKCKVKNAIINYTRKHDEFFIYVYCLQRNINIKNEENKLKHFVPNTEFTANIIIGSSFGKCPH